MRFRLTFVVIVFAALATGGPSAQNKELDNRTITCREFLASGQANMAALISWLRGYHAGKTGVIPYQSLDPYGAGWAFIASNIRRPTSSTPPNKF
jgi:HdeA/HdeB family